MATASPESGFNQALLYLGLATLVPLAGLTAAHIASHSTQVFNLNSLHGPVPKELLITGGLWIATKVFAAPEHYDLCNNSEVEYCYTFLLDFFTPLYMCLLALSDYFNCANRYNSHSFLVILFSVFSLLPSPITCWWLITWSMFVFLYQTWAMYGQTKVRKERVGLLHMNYVLTVHWLLYYYAYPPSTAHSWGETQSVVRDWQYVIHALAALAIGALIWRFTKSLTSAEETQSTPNLP